MRERLRIGTRRSALALWQAEYVASRLAGPGLEIELVKMTTRGDQFLSGPLSEVGGKGLFTREIEEALLRGEVDLAVHSLKDLPAVLPPGLVLAMPPLRDDPRDALCALAGRRLGDLPSGARVGTASLRRSVQLRALRPDLRVEPVRGNVPTRLSKLEAGFDAVILATAGLKRLGLEERITHRFEVSEMVPAVGQGILGLQHREGDKRIAGLVVALGDVETGSCALAERSLLATLGAGCSVPLGGHATIEVGRLKLIALLVDPESGAQHRVEGEADVADAQTLGHRLGGELLAGPARGALPERGPT
jgi:hydroxymethylbilane synthase